MNRYEAMQQAIRAARAAERAAVLSNASQYNLTLANAAVARAWVRIANELGSYSPREGAGTGLVVEELGEG